MENTKKNKGGRPSKYRSEMCNQIKELMQDGVSLHEVAKEIGVSYGTLNRWREEKKKFRKAVEEGISLSHAWWLKVGQENLSNKNFNTNLYQANMRNRFGWDAKQQIEIDTTVRGGVIHLPLSADLDALRAASAKKCIPVEQGETALPLKEAVEREQED